ncbi:RimJ/RimL family protein N-acetyltransferase [Ulvibacter sp. MAR_2010_11]|uniref:GNAT family N-acetyltransferase n=1 Tax=Ulvibacter sp. MAR_2010_11 TaxID=1250229 RepID=UPI000C2BDCF6|nr:GNAT family protein [Ulvibacter sp. MAR_2010_11]PKA83070.1 RimJ/RimL family protein N-acetyltransferase [Ulvibacter sp. MAR_2010_11]
MSNFNPNEDYILENEHLLLRPLTMDDMEHLSVFSLYEPQLWTYSLIPANGLENLKNYMEFALKGRTEKTSYPFIVFDKRHQKYAGSTRFYDIQEGHNTAQLGYTWYGSEFQGTGLNKNCKYLLLEFAFEKIGWDRVEFRADANNARSIAAMKSIGCVEEGILRSNCKSATGRRDSIVLSILQKEWYDSVKNNLFNKTQRS